MPYWFTWLMGLLLRDRRFRVHMGNDTSSWRPQRNSLPRGSVHAPLLFNLYCNDLPVTRGRKFIYADDICLAIQGQYFRELECSLSSDMAWMSHFCRQWRLKPSASKTISSVFHLHNTCATHELSVYLYGQRLRHERHPTYLGVTLDRTLSYREHLTKTAGKLKNRNNLLMEITGSTWSANTLWSSARRFAIQQQSTAPQTGHALLTQVTSMCSWTLPHLWYPPFYTSPMAFSALQHWTASPKKEGCHWQADGKNRLTWQLANPAWYP